MNLTSHLKTLPRIGYGVIILVFLLLGITAWIAFILSFIRLNNVTLKRKPEFILFRKVSLGGINIWGNILALISGTMLYFYWFEIPEKSTADNMLAFIIFLPILLTSLSMMFYAYYYRRCIDVSEKIIELASLLKYGFTLDDLKNYLKTPIKDKEYNTLLTRRIEELSDIGFIQYRTTLNKFIVEIKPFDSDTEQTIIEKKYPIVDCKYCGANSQKETCEYCGSRLY